MQAEARLGQKLDNLLTAAQATTVGRDLAGGANPAISGRVLNALSGITEDNRELSATDVVISRLRSVPSRAGADVFAVIEGKEDPQVREGVASLIQQHLDRGATVEEILEILQQSTNLNPGVGAPSRLESLKEFYREHVGRR